MTTPDPSPDYETLQYEVRDNVASDHAQPARTA
jgi:hypothetical protein